MAVAKRVIDGNNFLFFNVGGGNSADWVRNMSPQDMNEAKKIAAWSMQQAVGSWQLAVGSRQLAAGSWQLVSGHPTASYR